MLPGCSAVKLGYNNAPEISYWWLDGYLDFNSAQSLKVRADLSAIQTWHRQHELPAYVSTLEKLQRLAPANVNPAPLCEVYTDIKPRFQALVDQTEPTVAALALTMPAEQIDHLKRQLEKRSDKWRGEWIDGTPAERSARRVKQLVDWAELLYGRLEEPQLALLRTSVTTSVFDASVSYKESQRRHQDALNVLRQLQPGQPGVARAKAEIHALLSRAIDSPDAAYRSYMANLTQENCKTLAQLHNSTTPAQRVKALETLKDYETDARALMTNGR